MSLLQQVFQRFQDVQKQFPLCFDVSKKMYCQSIWDGFVKSLHMRLLRWEEQHFNTKKFGRTPPLLDRNHALDLSRLSCGDIPFVAQTFCPTYVEIIAHNHQGGKSGCFGTHPQTVAGTLPRHTDHQIPLCVHCLCVFFSLT